MSLRDDRRFAALAVVIFTLFFTLQARAQDFDPAATATATTSSTPSTPGFFDGFSTNAQLLAFVTRTKPRSATEPGNGRSLINPGNQLLRIPARSIELQARPNFEFTYDPVTLSAKPRATMATRWRGDFTSDPSSVDVDAFLQEGRAQVSIAQLVHLSAGREVLQWGPSLFISPSNPFFIDDGRLNPKIEVGARDFSRIVVTLSSLPLTFSLIDNWFLGRGREPGRTFEPIHALKIDYTGESFDFSVNASLRSAGFLNPQLGFYGQVTASDALLIYTDGVVKLGTDSLYPVRADSSVGWAMEATNAKLDKYWTIIVAGAAYTLEAGPTLTAEYLFNGEGYSADEATRYYTMGEELTVALLTPRPDRPLVAQTLASAVEPRLRRLRRNYVSLQIAEQNIKDQLNFSVRFTYGLDDSSWLLLPLIEWNFADIAQIFAVGQFQAGGERSEFGLLLNYQAMAGLQVFLW